MNMLAALTLLNVYLSVFCFIRGAVPPENSSRSYSELGRAIQRMLDAQREQEVNIAAGDDHSHTEEKNQGLINTIINHNNKIKHIENKYNFLVNNFANSSHVKEMVEKTKVLEHHVLGGPRPLRSWRDIVLVAVIGTIISAVLFVGWKRLVGPWLIKYVWKKSHVNTRSVQTVSEHVLCGKNYQGESKDDIMVVVASQNKKLDDMFNILQNALPRSADPVRDD